MRVDVRDHLAVRDGTTIDSAAFQAAVREAGRGGSICVPPGTYLVTSLRLMPGQTLSGAGRGTTLRRAETGPSGEPSTSVVIDVLGAPGVTIANLGVDSLGVHNFSTCIRVQADPDAPTET